MVLADILTETRKRWLKAFKLFKGYGGRKSGKGNRVSPALVRSPSYSGTVDARPDIHVRGFCFCRASLPAPAPPPRVPAYRDACHDSHDSSDSGFDGGRSESAYGSPACARPPRIAAVSYFNINDSEDSSSVRTECTLLDYDHCETDVDEGAQNALNESLELVSSL